MSAEATFLQAAINESALTTYTFSSQNLGAASADRHILVAIGGGSLSASQTISSVTVSGSSTTIVGQGVHFTGTKWGIGGLAIVALPTGTTGDVVVTFSGGVNRCAIGLYALTGLSSAVPYDSVVDTLITSGTTNLIDCEARGLVVATCVGSLASIGTSVWGGLTHDFSINHSTASRLHLTGASDTFASAQIDLAVTVDLPGPDPGEVLVMASWSPGPAIDTTLKRVSGFSMLNATRLPSVFPDGAGM